MIKVTFLLLISSLTLSFEVTSIVYNPSSSAFMINSWLTLNTPFPQLLPMIFFTSLPSFLTIKEVLSLSKVISLTVTMIFLLSL